MVISPALLLARCCCILMLLVPFNNVATRINTAVVAAATAPSKPSNARTTHPHDWKENGNADPPCPVSHDVAAPPSSGWTPRSARRPGELNCEFRLLTIPRSDQRHLVKLVLSLGRSSDMQQERRTTPTTPRTLTAAVPSNGSAASAAGTALGTGTPPPSPARHPGGENSSHHNNNKKKENNNNNNNNNIDYPTRSGPPESPDENSPSAPLASDLSPEHASRDRIPVSGTFDTGSDVVNDVNRTWAGDPSSLANYNQRENEGGDEDNNDKDKDIGNDLYNSGGHAVNDNVSSYGDKRSGDDIHAPIAVVPEDLSQNSREKLEDDAPTTRATRHRHRGEGKSMPGSVPASFCVKLIIQSPHQRNYRRECLHDVTGLGDSSSSDFIYYYQGHDAINVTVTWDPRVGPAPSLKYALVRASGVKCRGHCVHDHMCLLDSSDCSLNSAPQPQNDGKDENQVLYVVLAVVLPIMAIGVCIICVYCYRHRNRDTLLHQQQRPHCSEMYRSPSGSMQDASGSYDQRVALLPDRSQPSSSSHSHSSSHAAQLSPSGGIPNSNQHHQPSSLPSQHQHAPLSPYFRPHQSSSSFSPYNGIEGNAQRHFLPQGVSSKPLSLSSLSRSPRTYPPHIAMSRDGEEGYKAAQQALNSSHQQRQNWLIQNEVFRAPPNKTIYDRDSPPPPYSFNAPPSSMKSPELLVPGMGGGGFGLPRHMSSGTTNANTPTPTTAANNNNNSKHNNNNNNNNNMEKYRNRSCPPSPSDPAGCHVPCPPLASIYPPGHLSTPGPPPDYHQVAASSLLHRGHNPSANLSSARLPNQGSPPHNAPPPSGLPSSLDGGPQVPIRPSPMFCGVSPLIDCNNTFVVTNGSPSVCPGPDAQTTTHHQHHHHHPVSGSEGAGSCCPDATAAAQEGQSATVSSWPNMTVPSSSSSSSSSSPPLPPSISQSAAAASVEAPSSFSSPSCSSSSHVPVLPTSSSFSSRQVDSGLRFALPTFISATTVLENQVPGLQLNNNNNNNTINNNNNNLHNNYNMNNNNNNNNDVTTGHYNATMNSGNNDNINNNNNNTFCNNNHDNTDDIDCVANNCGVSPDDSSRLAVSKANLLPPTAPVTCPIPATSSNIVVAVATTTNNNNTTKPLSFSSSSSPRSSSSQPHHQHPQAHRHHTHQHHNNLSARQPQPSWREASHGVSFDAPPAFHSSSSTSKPPPLPPPSPSPPIAVTNSEYDDRNHHHHHHPASSQGCSDLVSSSESNGNNVFLGHPNPSLPSPSAAMMAVATPVLDSNGNKSPKGQQQQPSPPPSSLSSSSSSNTTTARDGYHHHGLPVSSPAEGRVGVAVMDPNENCDWSRSLEATARCPLVVSSSVNPWTDSTTPCCDNNNITTSAATAITTTDSSSTITTTTTTSSPSSSSPSSSSSSSLRMQRPSVGVENIEPVEKKEASRRPNGSKEGDDKEDAAMVMDKGEEEEEEEEREKEDLVGVVEITNSRHSATCTAAQDRVE